MTDLGGKRPPEMVRKKPLPSESCQFFRVDARNSCKQSLRKKKVKNELFRAMYVRPSKKSVFFRLTGDFLLKILEPRPTPVFLV